MSTIEKLRGFKDYYPEDQEIRERIFGVMRSTARIYGFLPVDYPSIEYLKLYQIKSGDELVSQTYSFQDKGERDVTLIPEATPSTVRLLLARKEMPRPVKWYNIPKLWRYEEPQSGRNREHSQFNCDFFGEPKWQADVEVISLACRTLDELGLRGLYEVRLNERVLMEKILRSYGSKDIQKSMQIIDRIHKEEESITIENLKVQGISENKIHDLMNFLTSSYSLSSIDNAPIEGIAEYEEMKYLKKLMRRLQDFGFEDVIFNPSTVRGLSYYTGIVFEGFDKKGEFRSIFGGGRYDNLTALLGGEHIPAVGFGMGDAVLEKMLSANGLWKRPEEAKSCIVIGKGTEGQKSAEKIANTLRMNHVVTELDLSGKSIARSMGRASSRGYTKAIIVGDDEAKRGILQLKDLGSGEQTEITPEQLLEHFSKQS